MTQRKLINIILVTGFTMSMLVWMWGNSIEQGDMSNAGYQVSGFLGTAGSAFGFIVFNLWIWIKNRKK